MYVGETKKLLKFRLSDHRGYVANRDTTKATGQHVTLPGHSIDDLRITVIEQVKKKNLL